MTGRGGRFAVDGVHVRSWPLYQPGGGFLRIVIVRSCTVR
jgi:hypothetical protein